MPGAHQNQSLPLLRWTGERKYDERLEHQDRTGRAHSAIAVTDKPDRTWGEKGV